MGTSNVIRYGWKERSPSKEAYSKTQESLQGRGVRLSIPRASVGMVVPFVAGRKRIAEPNLIWLGGAEPQYEDKEVVTKTREKVVDDIGNTSIETTYETTTTVTTRTIVGYTVNMALALCLGPDVRLRGVYTEGTKLWEGDIGGAAPTTITFAAGDTAYSNVQATFYSGRFDQAPNPIMLADNADSPAYVGIAYIMLKNVRSDLPLANLTFEVERFPDPLGLGAKNKIGTMDLNAVTLLAETLTNVWGAGGLNKAELDLASFVAAGNTVYDETNGGSMLISQEGSVSSYVNVVQDQLDALLVPNVSTGKLKLKLIRPKSVSIPNMLRLSKRNIIEIRDLQRGSWSDTIEQLRSTYLSRSLDYDEVPISVLNPAKMSGETRGRRTGNIAYPLVHSQPLGLRLLYRDLRRFGFPIFSAVVVATRDAANAEPGDIIQLDWPLWPGFVGVWVLVRKVRKSTIDENTVYLSVEQVTVPDMANLTVEPPEGDTTSLNHKAKAPPSASVITAPYWVDRLYTGLTTSTQDPSITAMILPTPADKFQSSFEAYLRNKPGSGDIKVAGPSVYSTFGKLNTAIDKYDGFSNGYLSNVFLRDVINDSYLTSIGVNGIREGKLFMVIDGEFLSFEGVTLMPGNIWQLNGVRRALLDTVADTHAANANVYIFGNNFRNAAPGFKLPIGYTPQFGLRSNTLMENGLRANDLVVNWNEGVNRPWLPLRPHDTRVDGSRSASSPPVAIIGSDVNVTWKTRTRASLSVKFQDDPAEVGEIAPNGDYQQHRVVLYDSASIRRELGTTPAKTQANALTVTIPAAAALGSGLLHVEALLGGRVSYQRDQIPIEIVPAAGRYTEDDAAIRTTEAGDYRDTE